MVQSSLGVNIKFYLKNSQWAGGVAKVVGHLPCKHQGPEFKLQYYTQKKLHAFFFSLLEWEEGRRIVKGL